MLIAQTLPANVINTWRIEEIDAGPPRPHTFAMNREMRGLSSSFTVLAVIGLTAGLATSAHAGSVDDAPSSDIEMDERFEADPDDLTYGDPPAVIENYTAYAEKLETMNPHLWGGGYVDGDTLVLVYTQQSEDSAAHALSEAGIVGAVELRRGAVRVEDYSYASDVVTDLNGLTGTVVATGPDYVNDRLVVEFADPDTLARAAATSSFDAPPQLDGLDELEAPSVSDLDEIEDALDIPFVATASDDIPLASSRYDDTSPYYGGSAIRMSRTDGTSPSLCTAGFAWSPPSGTTGQYLVTASHCAMGGQGVNKSKVSRYLSGGGTSGIGSVVWRSGGENGTLTGRKGDVAVIKLSSGVSSPRVYHGTNNTTSYKTAKAAVSLPAGWRQSSYSTMFTSGAGPKNGNGDGQISPDRVTKTNYTMVYLDGFLLAREQKFNNLTVAEHVKECVRDGDSGGAVYTVDKSGLRPAGIISGRFGGSGLTNCRSYFTPLSAVSSVWGGSVKTG